MSDAPRPFVWYELLTTDADAAEAFYPAILGWGTEPFTGAGGDKPYIMWTAHGAPLGGVMQKPPGAEGPPLWLGYVGVDDVDATVRRAAELGAQTHVAPRDIPNVGRFAVLADPQGAMFAIYKSLNPQPEPPGEFRPGQVSWHELATTDGAAAW
ncbi:MAG TPA: VOC family protein, partial [Thermoanaerobaculia bacterium]